MMEALSALLPYGTTLRIAWQMFTAPDITTQIPVLVQAVGAGIMTAEEARALLGMDAEAAATETTLAPDAGSDVQPVDRPGAAVGTARVLATAEALQKIYLAVGKVITSDEARQIINESYGADLPLPGPKFVQDRKLVEDE